MAEHQAKADLHFFRSEDGQAAIDEYGAILLTDHRTASALMAFLGKIGRLWPDLPMSVFDMVGETTIYERTERSRRAFYSLQFQAEGRIVTVWCFASKSDDDAMIKALIRQRVTGSPRSKGD